MFIKLLMLFTMFAASLIPTSGFKDSASDIRIQYTHIHEHTDHKHDHDSDVATTESDDNSHTEKHSHELVISSVVATFIQSKSNIAFIFTSSAKPYPKIQDDTLPLSHYLNSIFRPPIAKA